MATERKYSFYLELNPNAKDEGDEFLLQAHNSSDGIQTLYVGDVARCSNLAAACEAGAIAAGDFIPIITACASYFYKKDGGTYLTHLTALVSPDHKVYLGRRDNYDNHGHYLQKNYPMIFVSNNEDVLDLIAGCDGPYSLREMQEKGIFEPEELEKFVQLGLFTILR